MDGKPATGLVSPVTYYIRDLAERTGRSFVQGFTLAVLGPAVTSGTLDITTVNWGSGLDFGLGMALLTVITAIGAQPFGNPTTASILKSPVA
jgi:hypothetical protein